MVTVNVHEAKTHLSRLVDRAHGGEVITLSKAGKPYARLMPLEPVRQPGGLEGELGDAFFEVLPADELDAWDNPT